MFAYLDLATGSMVVQAAIAGIVVVPVLARNRIRALFGRNKSTDETTITSEVDATADVTPDVAAVAAPGSDRS
ncbi:MAG: hypothetical protein LH650_13170 [Chloroflexi bacterium]|nr:hypothetical protein [Chloroflexota bacterium]